MTSPSTTEELDAVILGAGVAGLYQLHQLREQGLRVRAIDEAGDVGGTWWWNRYPGARFDSEAYIYQYYSTSSSTRTGAGARSSPASPRSSVAALRHRPARPAQGHPVLHRASPARTSTRTAAAGRSPPTRGDVDRRPVLRHLRGHAVGADGAPLRGPGQLPRPDLAHVEVARGAASTWPASASASSASAPPASR